MLGARVPFAVAALLGLAALTYGIGAYPLLEPDEGRNAEVAREMAERNGYVLPRLNELPYPDKPILYFAAVAVAIELFGTSEMAVRLPSLAFTLLTAVVVAWFARRRYGPDGAWAAGLAYVASPFTLAYARTVIFDSAATLWIVCAVVAFVEGVDGRKDGRVVPSLRLPAVPTWAALGWAAIGLGVLTKGPVALIVPLLVALPYAAWRRRVGTVLDPIGLLVFLAIVLPWVFAVSREVPDFLHYVLVVETALRVATPALGRTEPSWYFVPILVGAALPWTAVTLGALRRARRDAAREPRAVLLFLWIVMPLLFFTLSQSKRPQYILPVVPGIALAVAHAWNDVRGRLPGARAGAAALAVLGLVLLAGATRWAALVPASEEVAAAIPGTARWLGTACVVAAAAALATAAHRAWLTLAFTVPVVMIPIAGRPLLEAIGRDRSHAELARGIAPLITDTTEIVAVGVYPPSLPFYLERTLTLVTADGRELTSNYISRRHEALRLVPGTPLRAPGWWEDALTFCTRPRIFVTRAAAAAIRERLAAQLPLIGTSRKVAVYGPCGANAYARAGTF